MQSYKIKSKNDKLYIQVSEYDGVIINTSPIADWMRGKKLYKIKEWAKNKGAIIEQIYNEEKKGEIWDFTKL